MIDGILAGKIFGKPAERTGPSGRVFVACKVRVADGDGEGLFISVSAFSNTAKEALLTLDDGDSVALTGSLKIGMYEARDGSVRPSVSMIAHRVMSAYEVQRKRKVIAEVSARKSARDTLAAKHRGLRHAEMLHGDRAADMDDDLTDIRF